MCFRSHSVILFRFDGFGCVSTITALLESLNKLFIIAYFLYYFVCRLFPCCTLYFVIINFEEKEKEASRQRYNPIHRKISREQSKRLRR